MKRQTENNMSKQNNKGLQRFTEIDKLETVEDFKAILKKEPQRVDEILKRVVVNFKEAYTKREDIEEHFDKLSNFMEVTEADRVVEIRRLQWQTNDIHIKQALQEYIFELNRVPTHNELEQKTGLSRTTISKHIKEGTGAEYFKEDIEKYKLMTTQALNALIKIGLKENNIKALKVYLDYFKDTTGGQSIKQQNNYLQINNTRVDELTVNQLPEEARLQIENIVKQYQVNNG